jgi:hypothetical protein
MAAKYRFRDYFPSHVTCEIESVQQCTKKMFETYWNEGNVRMFTLVLIGMEIAMLDPIDAVSKHKKNFLRTVKSAKKVNLPSSNKISWDRVQMRLANQIGGEKKNCDSRSSYRIGTNRFLVKKYFTFGERSVPSDRVHLVETTEAPMLVYRSKQNAISSDRKFCALEQKLYERYVLQPSTTYLFPEHTTYLLIAVQPSFFSLHVTFKGTNAEGSYPFREKYYLDDPTRLVVAPPTPYHEPPAKRKREEDVIESDQFILPDDSSAEPTVAISSVSSLAIEQSVPNNEAYYVFQINPNYYMPECEPISPETTTNYEIPTLIQVHPIRYVHGPYDYVNPEILDKKWNNISERDLSGIKEKTRSYQVEPLNLKMTGQDLLNKTLDEIASYCDN